MIFPSSPSMGLRSVSSCGRPGGLTQRLPLDECRLQPSRIKPESICRSTNPCSEPRTKGLKATHFIAAPTVARAARPRATRLYVGRSRCGLLIALLRKRPLLALHATRLSGKVRRRLRGGAGDECGKRLIPLISIPNRQFRAEIRDGARQIAGADKHLRFRRTPRGHAECLALAIPSPAFNLRLGFRFDLQLGFH